MPPGVEEEPGEDVGRLPERQRSLDEHLGNNLKGFKLLRNNLKGFKHFQLKMAQAKTLTVLYVPSSLDSGLGIRDQEDGVQSTRNRSTNTCKM